MNKEKLEKIKHLLSYRDIKALDVNSFILTKTGAEKIINEYIKVSRVELPVIHNGGVTESEKRIVNE